MKLNLSCGNDKRKGYINCDISPEVKPDKIVDITKSLPFKNNSIQEVLMIHTLEHTQKPIEVMKELYRICKNNALVKIKVPYFSSESAFSQLDHYSFFSWTSFDMLNKDHINHWQGVGNFKTIYKRIRWRKIFCPFELLFNLFPRVYQEIFCWWFPARELEITLKVIK